MHWESLKQTLNAHSKEAATKIITSNNNKYYLNDSSLIFFVFVFGKSQREENYNDSYLVGDREFCDSQKKIQFYMAFDTINANEMTST